MCLARCSLLVKLKLQGGNSVQKKRCPFFFLDGLFVSLVTLSLSDPSLSSSSPSPSAISMSCCEATDCVDLCESPLLSSLLVEGVSLGSRFGVKGELGSGRWPARPAAKLLRVGVFADGSSARTSSPPLDSGKNLLFGRGVVGVVSSPARADCGSGTVSVVLTAWNVDMMGGVSSCSLECLSTAACPTGCTTQMGTLEARLCFAVQQAEWQAPAG